MNESTLRGMHEEARGWRSQEPLPLLYHDAAFTASALISCHKLHQRAHAPPALPLLIGSLSPDSLMRPACVQSPSTDRLIFTSRLAREKSWQLVQEWFKLQPRSIGPSLICDEKRMLESGGRRLRLS